MSTFQRHLLTYFDLTAKGSSIKSEVLGGITTFFTMAYIIVVQPAVLSGQMAGQPTGMDFGAVLTATCIAAAAATIFMGLYARMPVALAPGMGQNFFFVATAIPAAAAIGHPEPWKAALACVFVAGVIFLALSFTGARERLLASVSSSMKSGICAGIGIFIAFIGLKNARIIVESPGTFISLNTDFTSPDILLFFLGILLMAGLHARKIPGGILIGMASLLLLSLAGRHFLAGSAGDYATSESVTNSMLMTWFSPASAIVAAPPSISPTFFQMDLGAAFSKTLIPIIIVFLFMDVFDTMGTLIGVGKQAGLSKDGKIQGIEKAMKVDSAGSVFGAALGTSTVTSFIESAAGIQQGGRTGLTSVVTGMLFLLALFFSPIVMMAGSYPVITAPALIIVGCMMMQHVKDIDWDDFSEGLPSFIVLLGIPLSGSIGDGLALGFLMYPVLKMFGGRYHELRWPLVVLWPFLAAYFLWLK